MIAWTSVFGADLLVAVIGDRVVACEWKDSLKFDRHWRDITRLYPGIEECASRVEIETLGNVLGKIKKYVAGELRRFDIAMELKGSEFRRKVWQELMQIPYGDRISYGALAVRIGHPTAVRAVASAVANNPISILIPCHRIVCSDGSIGRYAGGAYLKKRLLDLESQGFEG